MKLFTGWIMSAGLVLTAAAANAQVVAPYPIGSSRYPVSDFGGPYEGMPPQAPMPGYGVTLLPPQEVYAIVRESGFSPLGIPRQRGFIYTISVIDRGGDDGRLVIDARTGRIIRFVPAYRMGDNLNEDMMPPYPYGPSYGPPGPPPPVSNMRGVAPPPVSEPRMASRTPQVPLPKAAPPRAVEAKPPAAKPVPAPAQQSAAVQVKPADAPTPPPAASPPAAEAKPAAPALQPTQAMPKVQGLD